MHRLSRPLKIVSGMTTEFSGLYQRLTQDFPELPEPYNNLAVLQAGQGQVPVKIRDM